MDSAAAPSTAISSNGKISKLAPSKRALFLSTYRRYQTWSLPKPIIEYMAKNPSSSKFYEKIIKSCKYFFFTNPLLVVNNLYIYDDENERRIYMNGKRVVDLKDISCKLWLNNELTVEDCCENQDVRCFSSTILSKIYKSDIKKFILTSQNIILDDLIWLASKGEVIDLNLVTVIYENGGVVALEKIIEALPNIKSFHCDFEDTVLKMVTLNTVKEMIKLPHFSTLSYLDLVDVPESLNLDDFYSYIKKNKQTTIRLRFYEPLLSDGYKHRLQEIVNEIVQTEKHDFKLPLIYFRDMDESSYVKLCNLRFG